MEGDYDPFDLVGTIYDAALDNSLWPDVLDRLRRMVDCRAGALLHGSMNPVVLTIKGAIGLDPAVTDRAQEIFGDPNDNPFMQRLPVLKMGVPTPRQRFIDDETFERHRIYNDFFEPQGLFHDITTPVIVSPDEVVTLFLGRAREDGPLGEREARILLPWIPHVQRAMLIDRELRMHRAGSEALVEMMDRIACGIAFAGNSGNIMLLNRNGERIIEARDGLALRDKRLLAKSRTDNVELGKAIDLAVSGQSGGSLLIQRPSGSRPYVVFTVPLSRKLAALWPGAPAAVLIFSDPNDCTAPPADLLMALYGFTKAETQTALRIIQGLGLGTVAKELGISQNTVKTHLQRIFEKTGTCRQAELVRLLLGSPVTL